MNGCSCHAWHARSDLAYSLMHLHIHGLMDVRHAGWGWATCSFRTNHLGSVSCRTITAASHKSQQSVSTACCGSWAQSTLSPQPAAMTPPTWTKHVPLMHQTLPSLIYTPATSPTAVLQLLLAVVGVATWPWLLARCRAIVTRRLQDQGTSLMRDLLLMVCWTWLQCTRMSNMHNKAQVDPERMFQAQTKVSCFQCCAYHFTVQATRLASVASVHAASLQQCSKVCSPRYGKQPPSAFSAIGACTTGSIPSINFMTIWAVLSVRLSNFTSHLQPCACHMFAMSVQQTAFQVAQLLLALGPATGTIARHISLGLGALVDSCG